jgi:hypothetical protein
MDPTVRAAPPGGGVAPTVFASGPQNYEAPPPPPNPYEQPSAPNQYGAPPPVPTQYGAPPPPAAPFQPYGAPQSGGYGIPPQQPRKKSRVGLIVGIVLGVVVLLCITVSVIVYEAEKTASNTINNSLSSLDATSTAIQQTATTDEKTLTADLTPTAAPNGAPSGLSIDATASSIITNIQSASSIDSNYKPTNVTKTFQTNATVYVTYNLHLNGQTGYVEVKWYADGQVGATKIFHADQTDYTVGYFSIPYTEAVQGAAELYWCTQSDCSDEALAGYVNFTISDSGYHTSGQMVFSTIIWRRD